ERAVAHDRVVAVGQHVDEPVVEIERHLDPGVLGQEAVQRRTEVERAEADRRRDAQRADELAAPLAELGGRGGHLLDDAPGELVEGAPVLGDRDLARGPVEERGADRALELAQPLADHRLRELQAARGLADRAGLDDGDERCDGFQLEHRSVLPKILSGILRLSRTIAACQGQAMHALFVLVMALVPFGPGFKTQMIETNGTKLHVRVGGTGPAVVLLHGFGDSGDMWAPIAAKLVKDHTVIVPDLRGMGLSAHPDGGYTKKNQAADMVGILDHLKVQKADLVTHDIANMVGYALAVQNPDRIARWVVIDAPLPGMGDWDNIIRLPMLWHFNFRGPDMERLVAGRERIYLDRFWNELSADPKKIDEPTRKHYAALYARPRAMHDAFEQFAAFNQDAIDNKALLAARGKLAIPVLAVGGEKSFGAGMADHIRSVATNVAGDVVPGSGHWVMEENPEATTKIVIDFLAK